MTVEIGRCSEVPGTSAQPADTAGEEQKPAELVYSSAEEFLHEQLLPTYVRDVDGRAAKCASSGTSSTRKQSPGWKRSGGHGNTYGWTEPPASASGSKTTQTTT